jgi:hypothetical protein
LRCQEYPLSPRRMGAGLPEVAADCGAEAFRAGAMLRAPPTGDLGAGTSPLGVAAFAALAVDSPMEGTGAETRVALPSFGGAVLPIAGRSAGGTTGRAAAAAKPRIFVSPETGAASREQKKAGAKANKDDQRSDEPDEDEVEQDADRRPNKCIAGHVSPHSLEVKAVVTAEVCRQPAPASMHSARLDPFPIP